MKIKQRVFVVGYMHSGTSLLLQILSRNHELLGSHGESKYFDSLPMLKQGFRDLTDDATLRRCIAFTAGVLHSGGTIGYELGHRGIWVKEDYPDHEELIASIWDEAIENRRYGAIFRLVFDDMTHRAGRSGWIEKTPTHIYHIETILQDIPDARFVEIVRDPRDILASKKKRRQDVWHSNRYPSERRALKSLEKGFDPLWDALAWKSAVHATRLARKQTPTQIYRIRYEELVREPEVEVRAICCFLGLQFEPAMLDVSYRISADLDRTGHHHGITTDAIGRWKNTLSKRELAVGQLVTRREMEALGYTPAAVPLSAKLSIPFLLTRSLLEFGQRLVRKARLAGVGYVWNVVVNYGKRVGHLLRT